MTIAFLIIENVKSYPSLKNVFVNPIILSIKISITIVLVSFSKNLSSYFSLIYKLECSKNCKNNGICYNKYNIEYCYCTSFFFGQSCEINGLIIFVIGIVILIISFLACVLLWFCFIFQKKYIFFIKITS